MNKLVFSLLIIATLFATGCSEKFDTAAPYKDITVIYAFLDKKDTAHYIRIQKAFLDQNKNALAMSKEPDSSFYTSLDVKVKKIRINDTSRVADVYSLNRVDLTNEGYPKESGVFFNSPNYAYKFKANLDGGYFYRVVVTNLKTGKADSAMAPIIDDVTPGTYIVDAIDDTFINRLKMDFASTSSNQSYDIRLAYTPPANFSYQGLNTPVFMAYTIIRFNWLDSNINTHEKTPHYYDFVLGNKTLANTSNSITYQTKNTALYSAVASGIGTAPANVRRLIDRCDVIAYVTTYDYYRYQQASFTQGVGLTGNEIHPIYTNIKGENTLGIYTSRGMHQGKITLTDNTVDSLKKNSVVANVRIIGTAY